MSKFRKMHIIILQGPEQIPEADVLSRIGTQTAPVLPVSCVENKHSHPQNIHPLPGSIGNGPST